MAAIYGQLVKAQLENLASDIGTPPLGVIYFNTGTATAKYHDGVAWRTLVTTATAVTNVTTTRGDLIRRGATDLERFAAVTNNRVVRGDGTDVVLGQIDNVGFFTTGAISVPGTSPGIISANGVPGKTAGGSVAAGYVGETVSQAITTLKTTASADTFVDSSQTLTLEPGKWRIEYRGWVGLDWVSGTPRVQGALAIRTGSTTVETQAWRVTLTTSFPGLYMPAHLTAEVDISAQTVYKMSVVCEQASGTATATLGNNASAFAGTNVVANSKMVATRIA
jgi:hypothetical protein